jgi:uncharacterized protein YbjT (DUF2867 family)
MRSKVVVCGATGHQGQAVVRHLLASGCWDVVGVSRAPENSAAVALVRAGAQVAGGDLLDCTSLERAFKGAYGVFGITQPWSPDYKTSDIAGEIRQGKNIVDASVAAGVAHLVLSTALQPESGLSGIPHVDSKVEIEAYARTAKVPLTVIRPAQFMDNIGSRFFPVKAGRVRGFVASDAKVPYIACADIGALVSVAFTRRAELVGNEINAVGDFVSGNDIAEILTRLQGQPVRYTVPPAWLLWVFAREFYAMRRLFERYGRPPYPPQFATYMNDTRRLWPDAMTMERFLREPKLDPLSMRLN